MDIDAQAGADFDGEMGKQKAYDVKHLGLHDLLSQEGAPNSSHKSPLAATARLARSPKTAGPTATECPTP
jgi:hypothetical protein